MQDIKDTINKTNLKIVVIQETQVKGTKKCFQQNHS